jgi:hypothetical protein
LWEKGLENLLSVVQVNSMEVLGLHFLVGDNLRSIQRPQLRNVVEDLESIVLLILKWVVAAV